MQRLLQVKICKFLAEKVIKFSGLTEALCFHFELSARLCFQSPLSSGFSTTTESGFEPFLLQGYASNHCKVMVPVPYGSKVLRQRNVVPLEQMLKGL